MPHAKPRRARRKAGKSPVFAAFARVWAQGARTRECAGCLLLRGFASSREPKTVRGRECLTRSREGREAGRGNRRFLPLSRASGPGARALANALAASSFAASRLRVSQGRCGAWNASREAAKGAKEGGGIAGFCRFRARLGPGVPLRGFSWEAGQTDPWGNGA